MGRGADVSPNVRPVPEVILICVGDSFVLGSGDEACLGWVGRVAAAARGRGYALTHYNLGVGGDTAVGVAARWREEVGRRLLAGADCRLVLSVGGNDAAQGAEPQETAAAVREVIAGAGEMGLGAFVVGPPPVGDPELSAHVVPYSEVIEAACTEERVPFVETLRLLGPDSAWARGARAGDGSHPDGAGYAELAEAVLGAGWWEWLGAQAGEGRASGQV